MSDNIPYEIQLEIIKKVPDVKSLLRFRAVSKPWQSFIDSSDFIAGYRARDTQPHSLLLRYKDNSNEEKYACFVDDENHTLTQQQQDFAPNVTDLMKQFNDLKVIGSSHGLLCLCSYGEDVVILWNPSIRKSVGICSLGGANFLGFAVCPVSNDPTIVMITSYPYHVVIFTLSSKTCTVFQYTKLPPKTIIVMSSQVVIDRCIYWATCEIIFSIEGEGWTRKNYMIVSFDLIAKEIRLADIPHTCILNNPFPECFFISNLRGSLVLFVPNEEVEIPVCGVSKMEHDESFTKLFTISTPDCTINNILGFRKNGELVMETQKEGEQFAALELYEPCSEYVNNLGIFGEKGSFFMGSYKETLLLLDTLDSCGSSGINWSQR